MSQTKDVTLLPHVICAGNPGDGFDLYGPFPNFLAAAEHANQDGNLPDEWWIMPIHSVDDLAEEATA